MAFNLPFLTRHNVIHVVQGQEMKFHALTYGMVMRLRTVAKPLMKAFSVLFADKRNDTGQESTTSETREGDKQNRVSIASANPDVIKLRTDERTHAIEQLLDGALGGESSHVLIDILCNALPDDLPQNFTKSQKSEFAEELPMETLVEMIEGVLKANEKLWAPFKSRAGAATSALRKVLVPNEDQEGSPQQPEESSKTGPTPMTPSGST